MLVGLFVPGAGRGGAGLSGLAAATAGASGLAGPGNPTGAARPSQELAEMLGGRAVGRVLGQAGAKDLPHAVIDPGRPGRFGVEDGSQDRPGMLAVEGAVAGAPGS